MFLKESMWISVVIFSLHYVFYHLCCKLSCKPVDDVSMLYQPSMWTRVRVCDYMYKINCVVSCHMCLCVMFACSSLYCQLWTWLTTIVNLSALWLKQIFDLFRIICNIIFNILSIYYQIISFYNLVITRNGYMRVFSNKNVPYFGNLDSCMCAL